MSLIHIVHGRIQAAFEIDEACPPGESLMETETRVTSKNNPVLLLILGVILFILLFIGIGIIWPMVGIDWKETFYPVARAVLSGKSPYSIPTFRNVPWTVLPLLPFALLSETIGGIAFFIVTFVAYGWVAYKLNASRAALIAFLVSPPVFYGMRMLNVDILVLIGFILPAPIGLFFVIIKPQMGLAMVIFWLVEAWRNGGIKEVLKTFLPVTLAIILSFLFWGNWQAGRQADLPGSTWNASLWPWVIPIGVVLVALALRDRRKEFAISASPFLSPYLAYHSWAGVLLGLVNRDFELVMAVIGMWLVAVVRLLGYG